METATGDLQGGDDGLVNFAQPIGLYVVVWGGLVAQYRFEVTAAVEDAHDANLISLYL